MESLNLSQFNAILNAQNKAMAEVLNGHSLAESLKQIQRMLYETFKPLELITVVALYQDTELTFFDTSSDENIKKLKKFFEHPPLSQQQHQFKLIGHEDWPMLHTPSQALWSQPIHCAQQEFLGYLALLTTSTLAPDKIQRALLTHFAQFIAAMVNKHRNQNNQETLNKQLFAAHQRMQALTQLIPDLMFVLRPDGTIEDLFGGNHSLLMMAIPEFLGKKHQEVLPIEVASKVQTAIEQALQNNRIIIINYRLQLPTGPTDFEGRIIPAEKDSHTNEQRVLYMARDVTEQNKNKAEIERLAYYDPLTKLANRRLLLEQLEEKIEHCRINHLFGGLIFVDLDDFKKINDSMGHSIGDEFLIMIGNRLKKALPSHCTLARIGGDEFVVLIDALSQDTDELKSHAIAIAENILATFSEAFFYNKMEYHVGCSAGICVFDGISATRADQVMQQADMCMYQAKKMGGHQLVTYDDSITDFMVQRFKIESEIQKGIKSQSFVAFFQPQFNQSGDIVSAESLIRWQTNETEAVDPESFISVAENSGLINQLQKLILDQSCLLLNQIDALLGHRFFTISINISPNQFRTQLGQLLMDTLIDHGLEPERIKLEITESILLERSPVVIEQIEIIESMGFKFSIDDFGMGYSSLAYLHDLPVDELKIDKNFVDFSSRKEKKLAIIQSIATLAEDLEMDLIIEGIETEAQKETLKDIPFTALQGFYFSEPVAENDFLQLIQAQSTS